MQIKEVQDLYNNKSVKKIGVALNKLLRKDKGYSIQTELLTCSSSNELIKIITDITFSYNRTFKKPMLNDEDINEILSSVSNAKEIRILASMILTYSSIFINNKNKEDEEIEESEESYDE